MSLELLTVFVVGPMACLVCYDIAKKNPRANITMIIMATAELYGGKTPPTCRTASFRFSGASCPEKAKIANLAF